MRAENERLKAQSSLTLMGTICAAPRGKSSTIAGLDEMVLQIGVDDTVGYVNPPMARLLDITVTAIQSRARRITNSCQ